jgi:hypothetical protein
MGNQTQESTMKESKLTGPKATKNTKTAAEAEVTAKRQAQHGQ